MKTDLSKHLPQVDKLIKRAKEKGFSGTPSALLKMAVTKLLKRQRELIYSGKFTENMSLVSEEKFEQELSDMIKMISKPSMKNVINATGTIIHTNLGRAPLSHEILQEIAPCLEGYSDLEFDLSSGKRGSREKHLYNDFFKDRDMLIVNNNAAACFLVLSAVAKEKEVLVSRGELVEIGGAFRIPDIMTETGAVLKEVGTTNKTRISDYENAISEKTGLILKVHRSNFVIKGFSEEVSSAELALLAKKYSLPFYFDAGSGATRILSHISKDEPIIEDEIEKDIDIISFSGDKLMGGTQAGIIVAKSDYLKILKKHPLYRVLRPDKFTIFYLSRLFYYLNIKDFKKSPVIDALLSDENDIKLKAKKVFKLLKNKIPTEFLSLEKDLSAPGGGALPDVYLPTWILKLKHPEKGDSELKTFFLNQSPPVVARQKEGYTIIDMRTVFPREIPFVAAAINNLYCGLFEKS